MTVPTGRRWRRSRPGQLVYLSWGAVAGRSAEIAAALGGEAYCCFPPSAGWRPHASVRYVVSTVRTVVMLARRRPQALVVTNPPVFPGVIALLYGRLTGAPVVLDDHPGSFGAQGDQLAARLLPVHRRMVRRAALCLVTAREWCEQVEQWGGRAVIVHESPGDWRPVPPAPDASLTTLLYVCTFARDEPVGEVLEAARSNPHIRIRITGDRRRCPPELLASAPANVELVGLLPFAEYQRLVRNCDAVMALTTEPTSAMRAAFEAVWAQRPLIVSDWPLLAELFPEATRVGNDATAIGCGIADLAASYPAAVGKLAATRSRLLARWEAQLQQLEAATAPASDA
jgi:hypothetical protein